VLGDFLLFLVGLILLTLGADWVVTGASIVAERWGFSPLVIGLTVVAFGTSAPELMVSGTAAWRSQPGLAVGNVMGSTVANVGLIVGIAALIRPIPVHRRLLVRESPLLILVLVVVMALSWNEALGRLDGLAITAGFAVYLYFLVKWGRSGERVAAPDEPPARQEAPAGESPVAALRRFIREIPAWVKLVLGLAGLLGGANLMVDAAVALARAFDVPEAVIGATLVAVGTSLPELASTVAAAVRDLGEIAVGNVVGSNVFNLGLVLGASALIRPLELSPGAVVELVMPALLFCLALVPLAYTGGRVNRWEGGGLLLAYIGFVAWVL
jgi:cation:H+ antiporter